MNDHHKHSGWGWLRDADKARVERNRIERLNSLRTGSRRPLKSWEKPR